MSTPRKAAAPPKAPKKAPVPAAPADPGIPPAFTPNTSFAPNT